MTLNILIVNYNNYNYTVDCLESIFAAKEFFNEQIRICIVDNSTLYSADNAMLNWLNKKYSKKNAAYAGEENITYNGYKAINENDLLTATGDQIVTVIRQNNNKGFASANNIGLRYLERFDDWSWVWLLNNDTTIASNAFEIISRFFSSGVEENIGLVGNKLFYYDNPKILQGIGVDYNRFFGLVRSIGSGSEDKKLYDVNYDYNGKVSYVIGASMFVAREFVNKIGYMNEEYFLYFEELDWVLRGRRKGWTIGFMADLKVYHREGGTINADGEKSSILGDYYSIKNRLLFTRKFYPICLPTIYLSTFLTVGNRLRRMQFSRVIPLLKVIFSPKS